MIRAEAARIDWPDKVLPPGRRPGAALVAIRGRAPERLYVGLLAMVLAYAIVEHAGRDPVEWNICLSSLGLLSLVYWLRSSRAVGAPVLEPHLAWLVMLAPAYVACQLVPLPLWLLRVLSPSRASLVEALGSVMPQPAFAAISIDPAATSGFLLRIVACALTFLIVRELACSSFRRRSWLAAAPVIVIAVLEAGWGLVQAVSGSGVRGTYGNRNHFAGLLEMALPMALAYAVAVSMRDSARSPSAPGALRAFAEDVAAPVTAVVVILVGLVASSSKMGFVAGVSGLFVMGAVAALALLTGVRKWAAVAALTIVCAGSFGFLSTGQLEAEFAGLASSSHMATGEGRFPIWLDTLHLIRAYPLFGSGMGTYGTAFLKHQTAVVELDFTHAHNDYLELATELGIFGFAVFGALIVAVAARALRAVKHGQEWDVRLAALACAGALASIGLHSLVDFNLYMPANALFLAWIAGIAAGIPVPPLARQSPRTGALLRSGSVVMACLLIVCAPAWMVIELHAQKTEQSGPVPIARLLDAVRNDSASPHRWADLAEANFNAGRVPEARTSLANALALGPNIPPILLRAATLLYDFGEKDRAVGHAAHLLELTGGYDTDVFGWYMQRHMSVADVLAHGVPNDARASQAYVRYLMQPGTCNDVERAWNWVLARHHPDRQLAGDYVNFMSEQCERNDAAARGWALYLGDAANGYLRSTWVLNGDFESDPSSSMFDWRIGGLNRDVETALDDRVARTGSRSLRIRFAGKRNVNYSETWQTAFVPPGVYRFEAFVRTRAIKTAEGIRFRIFDPDAPRRLDITTEQVNGTTEWTRIEAIVRVPADTRLLRINVIRQPSRVSDENDISGDISGTAWIDTVTLSKLE
jgi:O-antigen ligase